MLELGERLGAHMLATGHYARVEEGPLLRTAADDAKDQSYVLSALAPASLARLRFPLGDLHKREVRAIATRAGLPVAGRRDSQDLCFLAGTSHREFLERHGALGLRRGEILDRSGARLGVHRGSHLFTVGQRRGLGIGGREPVYVLATDARANTVTVGPRDALHTNEMTVRDLTLHRCAREVDGVRLRAHGRTHACRVRSDLGPGTHPDASLELRDGAERTAPGQLACLYSGEMVVGHGTVSR
jgi:tRNA-specific 2-thiouridylase